SKRDSCISSNNGSSLHGIHPGLDTDEIINNEDGKYE
ncbi:unnamed protein product, partial [Rotaria magnacalcarata]